MGAVLLDPFRLWIEVLSTLYLGVPNIRTSLFESLFANARHDTTEATHRRKRRIIVEFHAGRSATNPSQRREWTTRVGFHLRVVFSTHLSTSYQIVQSRNLFVRVSITFKNLYRLRLQHTY